MHDLLVVGGGPGGIAAAAYGLHLGLDTLLISPDLGGRVNQIFAINGTHYAHTVYGADLVRTFASKVTYQAHRTTIVTAIEKIPTGFRLTLENGEVRESRALVLATGAKPRLLYVPGEERLWARGLSYSAISHAPLFANLTVAVIGNDRRAQVAALELSLVANRVFFITPQPQFLDPALMERINERGNTSLFQGWEVIAIEGDDYVTGISLQNIQRHTREIPLNGVVVELGLLPNSEWVADLVERDEEGRIKVDHHAATSHPGIFAAGDVTNVPGEQVPVALGEGIKAALSALEYIVALPEA
jgi:NADH-dependent peroxiredoxin subunit F